MLQRYSNGGQYNHNKTKQHTTACTLYELSRVSPLSKWSGLCRETGHGVFNFTWPATQMSFCEVGNSWRSRHRISDTEFATAWVILFHLRKYNPTKTHLWSSPGAVRPLELASIWWVTLRAMSVLARRLHTIAPSVMNDLCRHTPTCTIPTSDLCSLGRYLKCMYVAISYGDTLSEKIGYTPEWGTFVVTIHILLAWEV